MRRVWLVLGVLSLCVLFGCSAYLGWCYVDRLRSVGKLEEIREEYVSDGESEDLEVSQVDGNGKKRKYKLKKKKTEINWKGMNIKNKDIVAWIEIPDTHINYPVVRSDEDNYYLNHTVEGIESAYGAIYLSTDNSKDFSDSHNIIFGHNMSDSSMFHDLNSYGDAEYFKKHPYIYVYTPEMNYVYAIFSVYQAKVGDVSFEYGYEVGSYEFSQQVSVIKELSEYDTDVSASKNSEFITLMTCNSRLDYSERTSVHGTLIKKENN